MLAHLFKVTVASLLVIIAAMHFVVAVAEVDVGWCKGADLQISQEGADAVTDW